MARSKRSRKQAKGKPWHEPGASEKCQKINQAIAALESGMEYFQIIADKHTEKAFDFLEVDTAEDLADWVLTFLHEFKEAGSIQCFVGKKAMRCREPGYQHLFLFPYKIQSIHFDEVVYLKFGIDKLVTKSVKTHYYCHCTLHEDEPEKGA